MILSKRRSISLIKKKISFLHFCWVKKGGRINGACRCRYRAPIHRGDCGVLQQSFSAYPRDSQRHPRTRAKPVIRAMRPPDCDDTRQQKSPRDSRTAAVLPSPPRRRSVDRTSLSPPSVLAQFSSRPEVSLRSLLFDPRVLRSSARFGDISLIYRQH